MKKTLAKLALTTALTSVMLIPALAQARPVTFITQLKSYGYSPADLAFYVTDSKGVYQGSLWMAGGRSRYYRHLIGWSRATRGNLKEIAGITGASVGSGQTLKIRLDLTDALFDAGYQLHIDAAVENLRESPSDIVIELTTKGAGKTHRGRSFIKSFSYQM